MNPVFALVSLLTLVALGIGQLKPSWVLPWSQHQTKSRVLLTYGVSAMTFLLIAGLAAPVPAPIFPEEARVEAPQGN